MTQYNVLPKGNGKKGWKVEANGRTTSRHRKKGAAKAAARSRASPGDVLIIHNRQGRIMDRIRTR